MVYPTLRAEMARNGYSIRSLADITGIKRVTLYKKVTGANDFTWRECKRISAALGWKKPIEQLFEDGE